MLFSMHLVAEHVRHAGIDVMSFAVKADDKKGDTNATRADLWEK